MTYGPRFRHGQYVGGKETSTHAIWRGMISRCHNPHNKDWKRYGGLGITVCERWHKFENFLYDMGERPPSLQIDRYPDPHGHYGPGNCRWATRSQNQKNRRDTQFFLHEGSRLTPSEFATKLGISRALFAYRNRGGHYEYARVTG
jgi:hypothetical protein